MTTSISTSACGCCEACFFCCNAANGTPGQLSSTLTLTITSVSGCSCIAGSYTMTLDSTTATWYTAGYPSSGNVYDHVCDPNYGLAASLHCVAGLGIGDCRVFCLTLSCTTGTGLGTFTQTWYNSAQALSGCTCCPPSFDYGNATVSGCPLCCCPGSSTIHAVVTI